jgi:hypothetical protein
MLIKPVVPPSGIVARIWLSETIVKFEDGTPSNLTDETPVKLLPLTVTIVPTGPVAGEKEVIVVAHVEETDPLSVKSSSLNVPPVPLVNVKTTVTVPVSPVTGLATFVLPVADPAAGVVPLPTGIPLMVIDQFCGPELLRCRQKLKEVIVAW